MHHRDLLKTAACLLIASQLLFGATVDDAVLRVQSLLSAGDAAGAEQALHEAMAQYPNNGGLYNLKGIVEAQGGDYEKALADFQTAVKLNPRLTGAYLNLGRIYQLRSDADSSRHDKALDAYAHVLRIDSTNAQARLERAKLLLWKGEFSASLADLGKLNGTESHAAAALSLRLGNLVGLGRNSEAAAAADSLKHAPDLMEQNVVDIAPVLSAKNHDRILIDLIEAVRTRGDLSIRGLLVLGEADGALSHFDEAKKILERAAQSDPHSPEPLLALGRIAWRQQHYEEALGYVAHARDLDPKRAAVHFFFGVICIQMDLPVDARKALKRAIELDPKNAYYYYALGGVELQNRVAGEAKKYLTTYVSMRPDDPRGHLALGAAEYDLGEYDAAKSEMEKAAHRGVVDSGADYYLGRIARVGGDPKAAISHFSAAIAVEPDCIDCLAERGRAEMDTKDYPAAEADLEKALKLHPTYMPANEYLLALYQRTKDPRIQEQRQRLDEATKARDEKQQQMMRRLDIRPIP